MRVNTSTETPTAHNYTQAYYEIFILTNLVVWLPSKMLAYAVPFLAIAWYLIRARSGSGLIRVVVALGLYAFLTLFYLLWGKYVHVEFVLQNAILCIITYGSFLFFMAVPKNALSHLSDHMRYIKAMEWIILIESALGIFQAVAYVAINGGNFDSATGDVVQGTLSPLSFLDPAGNFNNQIYTANLLVLLMFYIPYVVSQRKGYAIAAIGFLAILMASVMHLLIAFLVAIALIAPYYSRSLIKISGTRLILVVCIVLALVLAMFLQPKNFALISYYFERIVTNDSPKTEATVVSVTKLPQEYPWVYVIGLGPGQYTSRAGLIGTGHYFGEFKKPKPVPFINEQISEPFKKYIYKSWEDVSTNVAKYGNSTMSRPFYSALSIVMEWGYVVFFCILFVLIASIRRIKRWYLNHIASKDMLRSFYALACASLLVFYFMMAFFENYLEVTQAIFPGLLLFRYFYSFLKPANA